ncbi:MAG TPA: NTP transferase domain-containing protein [Planctomycetota bacterium]|jgi:bifunctional UDP-N-acetylglucosamine pyrophosphorylase/glucosamine-1-phosphate N-acetyltransferase|nr:bifunctional UDP-N-acetylglucosamine diphosphorylase/glucosamine-1-phosphate N-acetyltransferase GlmU [Planctomycetota bacterium]MDP7246705.1 NTP transferase domain-containing protein [Planctomycetota bacterium]HJM39857.1 NTP transferase domain-containing protein [Planctomycetota bacterium]|tara:strand:+ start:63074 stop:64336 length:1263 start_codon:yes stop_codon:yes gene_type:complete
MSSPELHVLVLAGGESTRIRTGRPKALLDLCGRPLIAWVLSAASEVATGSRVLLLGPSHREPIETWLQASDCEGWEIAIQPEANGTGDAVRCALEHLPETGRLLILCGDTPALQPETLAFLAQQENGAMLSSLVEDPAGYGRLSRDEEGNLLGIVEEADCDEEALAIQEINAGVYALDIATLRKAIANLDSNNAQGEFYLTDAALAVLSETDGAVVTLEGEDEILGVNTLVDHARVMRILREWILAEHMLAGVQVDDPASSFIEHGVEIAPGARILPFTVIRKGCKIGADCAVGPFTHLRGGTQMAAQSELGNFVEAKNTEMGEGSKAKHLTYLGDTTVGARANIGCGTITANYDGKSKHRTQIGSKAFIGSGTVLVAPVKVGDGSTTGAGAVVLSNRDVPDGEVVIGVPAKSLDKSTKG